MEVIQVGSGTPHRARLRGVPLKGLASPLPKHMLLILHKAILLSFVLDLSCFLCPLGTPTSTLP